MAWMLDQLRNVMPKSGAANCSVRHEPCFLLPSFPHRAWLAPHSAVADLGASRDVVQ
jgi:hypothetical protein